MEQRKRYAVTDGIVPLLGFFDLLFARFLGEVELNAHIALFVRVEIEAECYVVENLFRNELELFTVKDYGFAVLRTYRTAGYIYNRVDTLDKEGLGKHQRKALGVQVNHRSHKVAYRRIADGVLSRLVHILNRVGGRVLRITAFFATAGSNVVFDLIDYEEFLHKSAEGCGKSHIGYLYAEFGIHYVKSSVNYVVEHIELDEFLVHIDFVGNVIYNRVLNDEL